MLESNSHESIAGIDCETFNLHEASRHKERAVVYDWQRALVERYPHLFMHGSGSGSYAPGYPATGDGWRELIERAIERIDAAGNDRIRITQIKEKFGTLRVYFDILGGASEEEENAIKEAVALAEARSSCTCEHCGAEGRLYEAGSWLQTACPDHARGQAVPVRPGFERGSIDLR